MSKEQWLLAISQAIYNNQGSEEYRRLGTVIHDMYEEAKEKNLTKSAKFLYQKFFSDIKL